MTKIESQLEDLKSAIARLEEALSTEKDDLVRDATIKRFEFTFELFWRVLSSILKKNNIDFYDVKTTIRDAARIGIISDPKEWFVFLEARNLTTHIYDAEIAEKVYKAAQEFLPKVKGLVPLLAPKVK